MISSHQETTLVRVLSVIESLEQGLIKPRLDVLQKRINIA